jgi:hypothetical protein
MALLRTCRQIYTEAVLMPMLLSIFTFDYIKELGQVMRKFKPHQRTQMSTIELQMEINSYG